MSRCAHLAARSLPRGGPSARKKNLSAGLYFGVVWFNYLGLKGSCVCVVVIAPLQQPDIAAGLGFGLGVTAFAVPVVL